MEILSDFQTSVRKAFREIDSKWEQYPGLVVCGSHSPVGWENLIVKIWEARVSGTPFLGICYGHQLAAIEYARNVLGIKDATSEEFGQGTFVVKKLPKMKVGGYFPDGSRWNNYEVAIETKYPKNFFTTQAHPEYESSLLKPHWFLKDFLTYCKHYAKVAV
jgi:CTP synthase (UTP-ammonia lyase)